jgi:heat shock protein HslJ
MTLRNALIATTLLISTTACTTASATGDMAGAAPSDAAARGAERERIARFKPTELINTGGWTLASADAAGGAGIAELRAPGIAFEMKFANGEVSASGGCNQLRGTYTVAGKRLDMNLAIVTRMACTDDKNLADRSFSEMMTRSFQVELIEPQPYRMRLTSDSGDVMVFQAKPIPL